MLIQRLAATKAATAAVRFLQDTCCAGLLGPPKNPEMRGSTLPRCSPAVTSRSGAAARARYGHFVHGSGDWGNCDGPGGENKAMPLRRLNNG